MRSLTLAILFCQCLLSKAQNDTLKLKLDTTSNRKIKHEICFIPYSGYLTPSYSYNPHKISNVNLAGIQYKIVFNKKFAIRFSAEYYNAFPLTKKNNYLRPGTEENKQFRVGYERIFLPNKKIKPYVLCDLAYTNSVANVNLDYFSITNQNTKASHDSLSVISSKTNSFKLLVGGGFKFTGSGKGFLSIETSFGIDYFKQQLQSYSIINITDGKNTVYSNKTTLLKTSPTGIIFAGNIVRLTIGISI